MKTAMIRKALLPVLAASAVMVSTPALAQRMVAAVDDAPEDAPPEMQLLARDARTVLKGVTDVLAAPEIAAQAPSRAA